MGATFMPMPLLCQGLNAIDPLQLKFIISGTLDKPQFEGLVQSLKDLLKPGLKNIGQAISNEIAAKGIAGVLEEVSGKKKSPQDTTSPDASTQKTNPSDAILTLQSLFNKNKQDPSP